MFYFAVNKTKIYLNVQESKSVGICTFDYIKPQLRDIIKRFSLRLNLHSELFERGSILIYGKCYQMPSFTFRVI